MTAKSLRSFPARNAFRVVNQNLKMTIVTCILYLLGIPMMMFSGMLEIVLDSRNTRVYIETGLYIFIGGACLAAAVFMGMIAAINSFTELHSKSKVDMLYSLPLTGTQRFFSDFIGGCCIYIVPYVVSVILGWIILLVMYPFVDTTTNPDYMHSWEGNLGVISKYYALLTFGLLALMLLYFALSSIITICCGTLFESIYTNLLLNLLIPGTMAAILGVIAANVDLDFLYMWQCIGFMSPVGGLIYLFYLISDPYESLYSYIYNIIFSASQASDHAMLPAYLRWIFAIVLISVVLVVVAWQLYIRRKAEHVSKPFVYLAAYYVMLTLVTVAILCIMSIDESVIGPALLFAAIVYFVMEVIRKRGFRKFWLTIITYAVTVAVSVGMYAVVDFTGCFGRVYYVPAAATVKSVAVQLNTSFNSNYSIGLEFTDRDMISAITGLHKEFASSRKEGSPDEAIDQALTDQKMLNLVYDNYEGGYYNEERFYYLNPPYYYREHEEYAVLDPYDYPKDRSVQDYFNHIANGTVGNYCYSTTIEIHYYTITGSVIHRHYDLNPDEYIKLLGTLQGTELYAEAYGNGLRERLTSSFRKYDDLTRSYELSNSGSLRVTLENEYYYSSSSAYHDLPVTDAAAMIDALCSAYQKDIAAMTAEQFRTAAIVCWTHNAPVYETCTETLAVLKKYGFEGFTFAERYDYVEDYYYDYNTNSIAVRIYAPGSYSAASLDYPCSTAIGSVYFRNDAEGTPVYQDGCPHGFSGYVYEMHPDLYALMEVARRNYISSEDCYALVVNGITYIIPPEHSDLAEAVIAKGDWFMRDDFYGGGSPGPSGGSNDDWWYDDDNWYDNDWFYDDDEWYGYGDGYVDDWEDEEIPAYAGGAA